MEQLLINGNKRLQGEVSISGAKNAAVALVPAALLVDDICVIENLPDIEDIRNMVNALNNMGVVCEFTNKNVLKIDSRNIQTYDANFDSVKKIRASYYLVGALLGRYKEAYVPLPGGCNFGDRPIDQHIKGFEALGAVVTIEHGVIKAKADKLVGTTVYFDVISVGATINVMLAAVYAEGVTIIENAAKEPHIVDTANFLNKLGAKIKGAGTDTIKITGVEVGDLKGSEYTTIPDQIEAGTYMLMGAATGGDVTITNIIPKHLESITAKLIEMGCKVEENESSVRVIADKPLKSVNVKTLVYPGFPTDMQPQMLALLCTAEGRGRVNETVWESRYQYVRELNRLGANITVNGNIADVEGVPKLSGTEVTATDLRAGAALVIGGLSADGETIINNLELIDRGYENIEQKLTALGADIKRVKKDESL